MHRKCILNALYLKSTSWMEKSGLERHTSRRGCVNKPFSSDTPKSNTYGSTFSGIWGYQWRGILALRMSLQGQQHWFNVFNRKLIDGITTNIHKKYLGETFLGGPRFKVNSSWRRLHSNNSLPSPCKMSHLLLIESSKKYSWSIATFRQSPRKKCIS